LQFLAIAGDRNAVATHNRYKSLLSIIVSSWINRTAQLLALISLTTPTNAPGTKIQYNGQKRGTKDTQHPAQSTQNRKSGGLGAIYATEKAASAG